MEKRFKLVLVKLVCVDVDALDFNRYNFKEEYLAIKDSKDEEQPYGIIRDKNIDIRKILELTKRSNYYYREYDEAIWEFKDIYKFKEVE